MSNPKVQELDWDDESLEESDGIRWFQVSADKPERFAVLSKKVTTAKTHYVKGQGYILCAGDDCPLCREAKAWSESRSKEQRRKERAPIGAARVRYAVLIAWYNVNADGTLNSSNPVDVGVLAFGGPSKVVQIREIAKEWGDDGDVRTVDMKAIISDKSKEAFQDFQLQPQKKCLYRDNKEVGQALTKKIKALDYTLADIIAKDRSVEDMEEMLVEILGDSTGPVPTKDDVPVEDIDDILSTPAKKAASKRKAKKVVEEDEDEEIVEEYKSAPVVVEEDDSDDLDAFGSILDAL